LSAFRNFLDCHGTSVKAHVIVSRNSLVLKKMEVMQTGNQRNIFSVFEVPHIELQRGSGTGHNYRPIPILSKKISQTMRLEVAKMGFIGSDVI